MAALYWKPVIAEDLKGTAYRLSDYDGQNEMPDVDVWPEHWEILMLYRRYSTQWRVSMSGVAGLDYAVFHTALANKGIKGRKFESMMDDLGIIEAAALEILNAEQP